MNPLQSFVIRQHQPDIQTRRNAARYGRWLCRRDMYLQARAVGRTLRFPLELARA